MATVAQEKRFLVTYRANRLFVNATSSRGALAVVRAQLIGKWGQALADNPFMGHIAAELASAEAFSKAANARESLRY